MERFKSNVHTVELAKGGHFFCLRKLLKCDDDDSPTFAEIKAEKEKLKAILLLKRADEQRYKKLLTNHRDGSHLGRDEYPKNISAAYDLSNRSSGQLDRNTGRNAVQGRNNANHGGNFAQRGQSQQENTDGSLVCMPIAGTDGRLLPSIMCYNCNKFGHYLGQCPDPDRRVDRGSTAVQVGASLVQYDLSNTKSFPKYGSYSIRVAIIVLDATRIY